MPRGVDFTIPAGAGDGEIDAGLFERLNQSAIIIGMLPDLRVRQRDYLLEVTRAITSRLELTEVLKLILQYAVELLGGRAGLVALREPGDVPMQYLIRASFGLAKTLHERLQPLLSGVTNPIEAQQILERNLLGMTQSVGMGQLQVVGLPLAFGSDVLGNLYIVTEASGNFSANDRRVLQSFADQAAIAVHNAQLYAQLAEEKRRLSDADEMKSTFIAAVSHELKTPVAIIKGYANTLANPNAHLDEALIKESVAVIDDETNRLTELIDNMLDASRAQAGGFKLSPVELDIDDLVVRTVRKFRNQTRNHTLSTDIARDLPLVYADEARVTQVLGNLINNAIKYSPNGGEIRVGGSITPQAVIISVRDQGKGIPLDEQARIFERFYRMGDAQTKRMPGTGLGLYLSKIFVEAHGGRVWVESDGKSGSTFFFSLPRAG